MHYDHYDLSLAEFYENTVRLTTFRKNWRGTLILHSWSNKTISAGSMMGLLFGVLMDMSDRCRYIC